jgi:hypothetical protein
LGRKGIERSGNMPRGGFEDIRGQLVEKGGEYLVASELFLRGFNAQPITIDAGIDIVCWNENNDKFEIQVKTRNPHPASSSRREEFYFNVRKKAYERVRSGRTHYIFVLLLRNKEKRFIIFPNNKLQEFIDKDIVREIIPKKIPTYRISIFYYSDTEVYLTNRRNDITYHLNKWDQIG